MAQEDRLEIYASPATMICVLCNYVVQGEALKPSEFGRRFTIIIRCINLRCEKYNKPYKLPITKLVLEPA